MEVCNTPVISAYCKLLTGSSSAMVLCGPETRDYLINYARSLIYTTALGFPFLASIRTAYELLSSGETESVSSYAH
jgi:8-amino-7-oxononanoate synthase